MKNDITKASIEFDAFFEDHSSGGKWKGLPDDLRDYFEQNEGSMRSIVDYLIHNKQYKVKITIAEIS